MSKTRMRNNKYREQGNRNLSDLWQLGVIIRSSWPGWQNLFIKSCPSQLAYMRTSLWAQSGSGSLQQLECVAVSAQGRQKFPFSAIYWKEQERSNYLSPWPTPEHSSCLADTKTQGKALKLTNCGLNIHACAEVTIWVLKSKQVLLLSLPRWKMTVAVTHRGLSLNSSLWVQAHQQASAAPTASWLARPWAWLIQEINENKCQIKKA